MNYIKYYPVDMLNGEGTRCTLFVAGCEHQCRGCYNQSSWRSDAGHAFTQAIEDQIIADLCDTRIRRRGLSLSGGDPLHPGNLDAVLKLIRRVRAECPDKDIWCWTGYRRDSLSPQQRQLLAYLDVLVDGKFEQALADPTLQWRGSRNQKIHRLQPSGGNQTLNI